MQNGQNLPRHFDVILGHVDRFETDQKALTPAPAGTAAPTGPATALASPGTSQTELIRVFYAVLYPDFTHTGGILANCRDAARQPGPAICIPLSDWPFDVWRRQMGIEASAAAEFMRAQN